MRNVDLVLDYYIAEGDTSAVLNRIGRKENKKNPDLWLKVSESILHAVRAFLSIESPACLCSLTLAPLING